MGYHPICIFGSNSGYVIANLIDIHTTLGVHDKMKNVIYIKPHPATITLGDYDLLLNAIIAKWGLPM